MKILFVCKGNNCRSQIAEAIYNRLTHSHNASSAGTHVDGADETLAQYGSRPNVTSYTLEVMQDAGYDLSDKVQKQLTKEMVDSSDLVISMAAKRYTPKWLASNPKYTHWSIPDPKGRSYKITKSAKDAIEQNVRQLSSQA